jgi:hypothetical protein
MGVKSIHEQIASEVSSWSDVTTGPGRFGSTQFLVGRRELGHLHGDSVLDLPLPKQIKRELLAEGRVEQHRYTPPDSGWVTFRIHEEADVEAAIGLLRGQYERAEARARRSA